MEAFNPRIGDVVRVECYIEVTGVTKYSNYVNVKGLVRVSDEKFFEFADVQAPLVCCGPDDRDDSAEIVKRDEIAEHNRD